MSNPALPARPRTFLFVCKGNICRSPAAEHLAAKVLSAGMSTASLELASAGLEANVSERSPGEAVQAGEVLGINLLGHRATRISAKLVESSDMVFVMEVRQLHQLIRRFPAHRHRFFLLPLFGNPRATGYTRYHIPDPYGKPIFEFILCFQEIRKCLLGLNAFLASSAFPEDLVSEEERGRVLQPEVSNW